MTQQSTRGDATTQLGNLLVWWAGQNTTRYKTDRGGEKREKPAISSVFSSLKDATAATTVIVAASQVFGCHPDAQTMQLMVQSQNETKKQEKTSLSGLSSGVNKFVME